MAKHKHSVYDEPTYQKFWSSPDEREYTFLSYYLKKFQHFGKIYVQNPMERFQLLPMFYAIPEDMVIKMGYQDFPRTLAGFLSSPKWIKEYYSDLFFGKLQSAYAFLIWPHFNVRGGLEQYSASNFFYITAHNLWEWYSWLKFIGLDCDYYSIRNPDEYFPYTAYDDNGYANINDLMNKVFFAYNGSTDFSKIKQVMLKHQTFEDFAGCTSHAKIDHYRKYYHTQSKYGAPLPLSEAPEKLYSYGDKLAKRVDFSKFLKALKPKDRQIVIMLGQKYTQEEIAERIGYSNNSGVQKRIKKIAQQYYDSLDVDTQQNIIEERKGLSFKNKKEGE